MSDVNYTNCKLYLLAVNQFTIYYGITNFVEELFLPGRYLGVRKVKNELKNIPRTIRFRLGIHFIFVHKIFAGTVHNFTRFFLIPRVH